MKKKYFALEPASFKLDGGAMFGIIPKPLWNKVHPADEDNRIDLALRLLFIQIESENGSKRNVLIDTGIGDDHDEKFNARFGIKKIKESLTGTLDESLKAMGLKALDVTDLIITHLHFDHVGGIGKKNPLGEMLPALPNATVHLHKQHYEYALAPTERDTGSFRTEEFLPIIEWYQKENKLHFLQGESGEILPGLQFRCSHGHTPFLLHPYDEQFIYMADLVPTSNHINIPWVMGYDIAPGVSTLDKFNFYQFIASNKLTMIFEHDPHFYGAKLDALGSDKNKKIEFKCTHKFKTEISCAYPILL